MREKENNKVIRWRSDGWKKDKEIERKKNSKIKKRRDDEKTIREKEREVMLGELPFHRRVVVLDGKPRHWVSP